MRTIEEFGVAVKRNSRLDQYRKDLAELASSKSESDKRVIARWSFAAIEADEVIAIAEVLSKYPDETALAKLAAIAKGRYKRGTDGNQIARNTQFELFVWALLKQSKLPIKFGDPMKGEADFVVMAMGQELQLEAKRLNSEKNLGSTVRKARKHFSSTRPGVVCMSIDHAAFGEDGVIGLEGNETHIDATKYHNRLITAFYERRRGEIENRLGVNEACVGMMLFSRIPTLSKRTSSMMVSNAHRGLHLHQKGSSARYSFEFILGHLEKTWGEFPATA